MVELENLEILCAVHLTTKCYKATIYLQIET